MKRLAVVLFLLIVLTQAGFPYLRALGPYIVDSTHQTVVLRGIGLGGWLEPEGYMLHTPGYGSPTDIENKILDLIGPANTTQFYQLYRSHYVNRDDIKLIAQWGFNSIRLPFHYKFLFNPDSGSFRADGFSLLDSLLAWCEASNMYVILDMHCAPGGQNKDNISDSDGSEARLWTNAANQVLTIRIWKEIARRYANRQIVGGYDLLNEPVLPGGYTNATLWNFYRQLTDSIRTLDRNHIVFLEGNWYATDFGLSSRFDDNMVYSFHKYWNETNFGSIMNYVTLRTNQSVPLWMGESGENSNAWFYEAVRLLEQQGIGWCWWTHKKVDNITQPLSSPISPDFQVILNYWNGQAARPSTTFATTALYGMAQNLSIDHCVFHPDVLKSLFDPDFGARPKPFKNLSVPGIVDAVDYDFGTNGVAYQDADYKNVGASGGSAYNQGYACRNDGVDIEKCQDPSGAPYDIGWIDSGEWINYTINIASGGLYLVNLRVASPNSTGQIGLSIDNVAVTNVVGVPRTGGWQAWTTLSIDNVPLPAGQHVLTVSFLAGGYNLNRMDFVLISTDVQNELGQKPLQFELAQNFPNPFNPATVVRYELPVVSHVKLVVYDILGRKVATLVSEVKQPGIYTAKWDAGEMPGGIYFCSLHAGEFVSMKKMLVLK